MLNRVLIVVGLLLLPNFAKAEIICLESGYIQNQCISTPSLLSKVEAQQLVDHFLSMESIPFRYPADGCAARAVAMAWEAENQFGIEVGRIFVTGALQVRFGLGGKLEFGRYDWHTAVVVWVDDGVEIDLRVIDPALFSWPVSVEEWTARLVFPSSPEVADHFLSKDPYEPVVHSVYYGERFQYDPAYAEDAKTQWLEDDLEAMKLWLAYFKRKQDRFERTGR